ncbi:expressed unknown protein [Seminavis robusta]|uniref:Uncharacterized protein n=1 Tax=Seminavis robusta TaxID=568900 RepID=A0A9N8HNK9_9STRA|nr:expressed unknown protein [Seminavis robusta]|eukprot:Sro829_g208090.1 n/a (475) ;mRNA; f:13932-15356
MLQLTKTTALLLILFFTSQIRRGTGHSLSVGAATAPEEIEENFVLSEYIEDEDTDARDDFEPDNSDEDEEESSDNDDETEDETDPEPTYVRKALRQRTRPRRGDKDSARGSRDTRELKGKGKGGGYSSGRSFSRSFLDPDIEPKPFINCIPIPPDFSRSNRGSKSKGGKGKGGKGKGNRRNGRRHRSKRRNLKGRDLKGGGRSSSSSSRSGRNRMNGRNNGGKGGGRGRNKKLPYCPLPTFPPTFLPSQTPIPTFTPLPTVTPFPTFTPFPTEFVSVAPTVPPSSQPTIAPSVSSRPSQQPTRSNAPSLSAVPSGGPVTSAPTSSTSAPTPTGATTRLIASRLGYSFFAGTTIRAPTTEELNGLVTATNNFFDAQLQLSYPNSYVPGSASMTNIAQTFDANAAMYPVILDYDLTTSFTTSSANTPTAAQIFAEMETYPFTTYIEQYVWNAEPQGTSLFFDTEMVVFRARSQAVR